MLLRNSISIPLVCRYVATQLDICSRCDHSIYFSLRSKFDMLPSATSAAMRLTRFSPISFCRKAKHIESPQGIYRAAAGGISSDASAAHIDFESSCETHDTINMGHKSKRSQKRSKMGIVKAKSLKIIGGNHHLSQNLSGALKHISAMI